MGDRRIVRPLRRAKNNPPRIAIPRAALTWRVELISPPTSPACRGSTRSTMTRTMVGIDMPMPRPMNSNAGASRATTGSRPASARRQAHDATRPAADSTKSERGRGLAGRRPICALKVEPTQEARREAAGSRARPAAP